MTVSLFSETILAPESTDVVRKVWCYREAGGAYSSAVADGPLLLCSQALDPLGSFSSSNFSVGRLPFFGAGPLRSPEVHPVPRGET